jgi:hypothetical protein
MAPWPLVRLFLLILLLQPTGCSGTGESGSTNPPSDSDRQASPIQSPDADGRTPANGKGLVEVEVRAEVGIEVAADIKPAAQRATAESATGKPLGESDRSMMADRVNHKDGTAVIESCAAAGADSMNEADKESTQKAVQGVDALEEPDELPVLPAPEGAKQLSPKAQVWVDPLRKVLIVDGHVSLRQGYLEMFACPAGTKEHESIVAVQTQAYLVHAGLLAIGAEPGHPVQYQPEYVPPSGAKIEIEVRWQDQRGVWHTAPAQDWMTLPKREHPREGADGESLEEAIGTDHLPQWWVFAGSGFWIDESTGKQHYMAEGGDLICVSNFSTATLDFPVESSQANEELLFMANTERIPRVGTAVRLVLRESRVESPGSRAESGEHRAE